MRKGLFNSVRKHSLFQRKANWPANYLHLCTEIQLKLFSPVHFKCNKETHTFFYHKAFFCLFREAISRVCEAMPGAKRAFKKRKVFFFLVVQLTVFSLYSTVETRHSRQVTLRQLWELQLINHLEYWLFLLTICCHLPFWSGSAFVRIWKYKYI